MVTAYLGILYTDVLPRDLVPRLAKQERVLADLALIHVDVDLAHARCSVDAHLHLKHIRTNTKKERLVFGDDRKEQAGGS